MALSIRRGASKVIQLSLEGCEYQDYIWEDFGTIRVRLSQGSVHVDKIAQISQDDATACLIYFSQADTIQFSSESRAKLQVFTLRESQYHQLAIKTKVFDVLVEESLWDEVVTDGTYSGTEDVDLFDPDYPAPIGHDYYGYLHIDVNEFRGIISDAEDAQMLGDTLMYDPDSETLYSETS